MKRARLWEDTVVLALRDQQWLRRLKSDPPVAGQIANAVPAGMIKLDGNAESNIGDVALRDGEKFFIFEVKSERFRIRDEWRKAGTFRPKLVFQTLRDLAIRSRSKDARLEDRTNVERSFRCHYFAYWWLTDDDNDEINGSIVVEPYMAACARLRNASEIAAKNCIPSIKERLKLQADKNTVERVRLSEIFECRLRSLSQRVLDCGLDKDEFQSYINFLCKGNGIEGGGEPIHAIVLSTLGSFFRVVSDTNHLASLLGGQLKPEPPDPRATSRASDPDHRCKSSSSLRDGI